MVEIETPPDPTRVPRGEPTGEVDGVPVYDWGRAPGYLRTVTQLGEQRLKLAPGQKPLAYIDSRKFGRLALYDPAGAAKMKPLTGKQKLALEAKRTCRTCKKVQESRVYGDCERCWKKASAEQERIARRTCWGCRTVRKTPFPKKAPGERAEQYCGPCTRKRAREKKEAAERAMVRATTCSGGCGAELATREEVTAWKEANPFGYWSARCCDPCKARQEAEAALYWENQRLQEERAREARRQEVRELAAWAAEALADPSVVILDSETTGLESDSAVVELAVVTARREVVLNTLLAPGVEIPRSASRIHGIDAAAVEGAPAFGDVLVELTGALMGRRVLIYNRSYDVGRLRWELVRHYRAAGHPDPEASAAAWLEAMTWEDVMIPYSDFVGDWSDYHGNNRWQPLGGGHRALGDCLAVVDVLEAMAARHTSAPADELELERV
ncbi:exonuclease domain-containing protein [Kitasatospora sp. NPDC048194]|uniref:3'-5' exonuclease n=1 Tax=Kitasatospora sp. NPDC048194 TaxID=3364045 RepID=UPI003710F4EB